MWSIAEGLWANTYLLQQVALGFGRRSSSKHGVENKRENIVSFKEKNDFQKKHRLSSGREVQLSGWRS